MANSNLSFSVAEATQIFKVDKLVVKTWAFKFAEYLSVNANPPKGIPREFNIEDIRVMAHVFTEWEDDPDLEGIKIGLNANNQFENPNIDNLITSLIPLFIDPPENMDENWKHGVIYCGLASLADMLLLARSYKLAGDRLVEISLENEEAYELLNPAMFNYRHSIELYLKVITKKHKQSHDLAYLYNKLKELLKSDFNSVPPLWFENVIFKFDNYDPGGTTFRYGEIQQQTEVFIDFIQLKKLMDWLSQSFQNILLRQGVTW